MNAASMVTVPATAVPHAWRGRVGILSLILAEISLFGVFVVAYLFYIGKSLNGPYPKDVLDLPVLGTNLFGTTYYPLVGLHASHVIIGLVMLSLCCVFAWTGSLRQAHADRVEIVSWYWHFVDAVWVVVFTVVYVIGR